MREVLATAAPSDAPLALVVGVDDDVLGCLAMNGIPDRMGIALARIDEHGAVVPTTKVAAHALEDPALPLLLLRDASVYGQWVAAMLRHQHGDRVRDLGLTPAVASRIPSLPCPQGPAVAIDPALMPQDGGAWLAAGHWAPVAALPPTRLIKAVSRGVAAAVAAAPKDEDRLSARSVGFL